MATPSMMCTGERVPCTHSYTGENSTEISCRQPVHSSTGSPSLTEVGCRQAEPGRITRRAYLNSKMDLSQAEAVADLITSTNKATHRWRSAN